MKNIPKSDTISFFIIVASIVLYTALFTVLHPGIRTHFSWYRNHSFSTFIETITQEQTLSPKVYWQFREFYSRGNFRYDERIIGFDETQRIKELPENKSLLMHFESPYLRSDDYIVKRDSLVTETAQITSILEEETKEIGNSTVIFHNDRTRVFETDNTVYIIFIKTIQEMRQANGLSDYISSEQELLQNTMWLNVTTIKK